MEQRQSEPHRATYEGPERRRSQVPYQGEERRRLDWPFKSGPREPREPRDERG